MQRTQSFRLIPIHALCIALFAGPASLCAQSVSGDVRVRLEHHDGGSWVGGFDTNHTLYRTYLATTRQVRAEFWVWQYAGGFPHTNTFLNGNLEGDWCETTTSDDWDCDASEWEYDLGEGTHTFKADLYVTNYLGQTYKVDTQSNTITVNPPLPAPTQYYPLNGNTGVIAPYFEWSQIANADHYILRIDPNSAAPTEHKIASTNVIMYVPTCDKIWWGVRAVSTDGGLGVWSPSWHFYTYCPDEFVEPDSFTGSDSLSFNSSLRDLGGTNVGNANDIESSFELLQNYPNPFNPDTQIEFILTEPATVRLLVYDASGREVYRLVDDNLESGAHVRPWDASNYPSGTYLYQLEVNGRVVEAKSMVLLK